MKENNTTNTEQMTPEQATALVESIILPGSDAAALALTTLVMTLAHITDEETRVDIAVAVAERAYTRTNAYGNSLLTFLSVSENTHTIA